MTKLTETETGSLVDAGRKTLYFKLMQAKAWQRLAKRAEDVRTSQLLDDLAQNEARDCELLSDELRALAPGSERPSRFMEPRIGVMMRILGVRGFLEWAIIAEDEAVEEMALVAASIDDPEASGKWTRIAADERLHVRHIKEEILGMESWEMGGGGGVADVIFGANDGLVSILALVAGVYGAVTESHLIFIAGVAGAVAGAISMGAGAYLSSKSENELTEKENDRKSPTRKGAEEQIQELVSFYRGKGLSEREAEGVAHRVVARLGQIEEESIGDKLGIASEQPWPPLKACLLTGSSFAVVSLIPILPFALMEVTPAVITAAGASIGCLFAVGASKAIFTRKSWIRSGLEMMIIGTLAAVATYLIGMAIPE